MSDLSFFSDWVRATHFVNIILLSFLIRSGLQILSAFPRLYFTDNCRPGAEWVKFTTRKVPPEDQDQLYMEIAETEEAEAKLARHPEMLQQSGFEAVFSRILIWLVLMSLLVLGGLRGRQMPRGRLLASVLVYPALLFAGRLMRRRLPRRIYTSLDEELDVPAWLALPGGNNLGLGRHWHFFTDIFWIANGLVYVALLIISGEWRRLVPTSWAIFPEAWTSIWGYYLHFRLAPDLPGQPFNAVQKLSYFAVIFLLGPLQIATGIAMSPSIAARFPWYTKVFGGRQSARSLHFLSLVAFVAFVIIHTFMVIIHGFGEEVSVIIWGRPVHLAWSVAIAIVAVAGIVALHAAASWVSLRHPRGVQRALGAPVRAATAVLFGKETSRQEYLDSDISPYFWINGHPPVDREYKRMAMHGFGDWTLEVGGMVEHSLSLSLDDLRAMPKQIQTTKHNCIQGWSDIGEWGGVQLSYLMEMCRPLPDARYVVFHAMDNKSETEQIAQGRGYFYETIDIRLARHRQTILAYEFNGQPLPVPHGAPLRLRVETQLGFKMVKWLRSIEFVADYRSIGEGQGGWREDYMYYDVEAGI